MIFRNGKLYNNDFKLVEADLVIDKGKIAAILEPGKTYDGPGHEHSEIDISGKKILPGMIDIHIHGSKGADTMDGDPESLETMSRYLAGMGITSFLPTTMTASADDLVKSFSINPDLSGAKMLGFNMEGPFMSVHNRGAHREDLVRPATLEEMEQYLDLANIKVVTIAPETEGAMEFISAFSDRIVCSIGHTVADYETTIEAIRRGAKSLTHTFNAMPGIKHREPGVIPAAAVSGIYGELIADGVHIHPAVVYCAYRLFGKDKLILISDAMRAAGLDDGEYELGGQTMRVEGGTALSPDNKIAGGTGNCWLCLTNAVRYGIPESDAVRMVTINPATLIGEELSKGSIAVGKDADLLVVEENLTLDSVYIQGVLYDRA